MIQSGVEKSPGSTRFLWCLGSLLPTIIVLISAIAFTSTLLESAGESSSSPIDPDRLMENGQIAPNEVTEQWTFFASADSFLSSSAPNSNYGTWSTLRAGYDQSNFQAMRMLFRFNLSSIPQNSIVYTASMNVYQTQSVPSDDVNMGLQAQYMKSNWTETGVTWNNANYLGGDVIGIGDNTNTVGWKTIDVTNVVREWVSGSRTNYGFIVTGMEDPDANRSRTFYSRQQAGFEPRLTVNFGQSCDILPPDAWVETLPEESATSFVVTWSGSDYAPAGCTPTGIAYFDVQYDTNSSGWINWQSNVTGTMATLTGGVVSEMYLFRARAADLADNVQEWPDAQAWTTVTHYLGALTISKQVNGLNAGSPPSPNLRVGETVTWTYIVENTGDELVEQIEVWDSDDMVAVECGGNSALPPAESMTCYGTGIVHRGQYSNTGSVSGKSLGGIEVTDDDTSYYLGLEPILQLNKYTVGLDADNPPGPLIKVGDTVTWTYVVENIGDVLIEQLEIADSDIAAAIECGDIISLTVGESATCVGIGVAQRGQYSNTGTASGIAFAEYEVEDDDVSHYFGADPSIFLEIQTNGINAENPPGPPIKVGDPITWSYKISNEGNVRIYDLLLIDDRAGVVQCPNEIMPSDTITCTKTGEAKEGQYQNTAIVSGEWLIGQQIFSSDTSYYHGYYNRIYLPKISK